MLAMHSSDVWLICIVLLYQHFGVVFVVFAVITHLPRGSSVSKLRDIKLAFFVVPSRDTLHAALHVRSCMLLILIKEHL